MKKFPYNNDKIINIARCISSKYPLSLVGSRDAETQLLAVSSPSRPLRKVTCSHPMRQDITYVKYGIGNSLVKHSNMGVIYDCRKSFSTSIMKSVHPFEPLSSSEINVASSVVQTALEAENPGQITRFIAVSLLEPSKDVLKSPETVSRQAEVIILNPSTGIASEFVVDISNESISTRVDLEPGVQPMFTPEDCDLAEQIVKNSTEVQEIMKDRYGIEPKNIHQELVCDPWSVHQADKSDKALSFDPETGRPQRLIQTFLYQRMYGKDMEDNHYAHPIDITPVVDLNTEKVIKIDGLDRLPPPEIPKLSVNYHRDLLSTNSYLETTWREDQLKQLDIIQPDGPSFTVSDNHHVDWQNWSFRVGFNYREGLVLHDLKFKGRQVVNRASLVEMAVPYGDPNPPYQRKCAFDVGDYGLGYCANSLQLGCDCLGHIHYFDATLSNSKGEPVTIPKAVCMHEEDSGILWKHVEYRNGHNESRRGRELIISSIATVVNYEYLFYWKLRMDGSIEFEIKLTGELSTNLLSKDEEADGKPTHGTLVAPGVNAQIHQHMFCARLDMAVDGEKNTVSEVDIVADQKTGGIYGNSFLPQETVLRTEKEGIRVYDANKARTWKISNAEGKVNKITQKPVAYKLIPFSIGAAQPTVLTAPDCNVTTKGEFSTAHLWITPYNEKERFPAGM